ncbi:transcription factor MYB119-like [Olea europaea var. sylvestris]|uniref:transcription factor MYB119-like n=1 Tax=Olea europaea var. sylvestris TaxID=158386 RepID=UPI000C1D1C73|nr:transcription factor MYB119-like [Olea europaea var. sylvestris]
MAQPVITPPESQAFMEGLQHEKQTSSENLSVNVIPTPVNPDRKEKREDSSSSEYQIKSKWIGEEDRRLIGLVHQFGLRKWAVIAEEMKDVLTDDEERWLIQAHERLGNRWLEIAKYIPGRTEISIKNHWNATKRRQISRRKMKKVKGDRRHNGSISTNSNSSTTTTAANPSNAGTRLSSDEDSTPFFSFESCNKKMDFMKTLFENNLSIDSIPVDHCQLMNPAKGISENTYSFNIDENYNHPTIFFTFPEILQTTNSQLPTVEYVENNLFHSTPNPIGNKFFHSKNLDLVMEFNSNFRSVETGASQIYLDELYFSYQWDGDNARSINLTTNLPTINRGTTFRRTMDTDLMDMVSSSQLPPQLSPYNGFF